MPQYSMKPSLWLTQEGWTRHWLRQEHPRPLERSRVKAFTDLISYILTTNAKEDFYFSKIPQTKARDSEDEEQQKIRRIKGNQRL